MTEIERPTIDSQTPTVTMTYNAQMLTREDETGIVCIFSSNLAGNSHPKWPVNIVESGRRISGYFPTRFTGRFHENMQGGVSGTLTPVPSFTIIFGEPDVIVFTQY